MSRLDNDYGVYLVCTSDKFTYCSRMRRRATTSAATTRTPSPDTRTTGSTVTEQDAQVNLSRQGLTRAKILTPAQG